MRVVGIDAGPKHTAYALIDTRRVNSLVEQADWVPNEVMARMLAYRGRALGGDLDHLVVERITPRGAAVGLEVLDTAEWNGKFMGLFAVDAMTLAARATSVGRSTVCAWATGNSHATKSQVAHGISDLWGSLAEAKAGRLAGLTVKHTWDAAACALWWLLARAGFVVDAEGGVVRADACTGAQGARRGSVARG